MSEQYWLGEEPIHCHICNQLFQNTFIDGQTNQNVWAMMCRLCHLILGKGFGAGLGQMYQKQFDGRWLQINTPHQEFE